MRMPLKINRNKLSLVAGWLPSSEDPRPLIYGGISGDEFSRAISVFRFGKSFKTTSRARFPKTVDILGKIDFSRKPVVLDIGASDGITSLHLISTLSFAKYYVTDLHIEVGYAQVDGKCYFYDREGSCILYASDKFIVYPPDARNVFPFGWLARQFFKDAPNPFSQMPKLPLVNPEVLQTSQQVQVLSYDVFEPWHNEPVDLVVVANMLNRRYFSENQMADAVGNMIQAAGQRGRIAIIESREYERSTIFRVGEQGLWVEHEVGGGAEIRDFVLQRFGTAQAA